jgi:hypothetical protein
MEDVPHQPDSEPLDSEEETPGPGELTRNRSSDLPPDPFREGKHEHALARASESLPHHPIHILERLLSLPPLAGLIDLVRTVWWRKKNPFTRLMWRALWGRRPVLYLALTVITILIAVVGPTRLVYCVFGWLPTSQAPTKFSLVHDLYYGMLPAFLGDPALYVAAVLAWRIRQFRKNPAFDSDLAAVPNWRPFVFRAVGVQVCAAAFLIALLSPVEGYANSVSYLIRNPLFFSNSGPYNYLHFTLDFAGIWVKFLVFMIWLREWALYWVEVALFLAIFLRAKTIPRLIGGVLAVSYSLVFFYVTLDWTITAAGIHYKRLVSLVAYLLIAGWLWHSGYRRFCREDSVPRNEP